MSAPALARLTVGRTPGEVMCAVDSEQHLGPEGLGPLPNSVSGSGELGRRVGSDGASAGILEWLGVRVASQDVFWYDSTCT